MNEKQALRAYSRIMARYRRTGELEQTIVRVVRRIVCDDGMILELVVPMGLHGERFPSWCAQDSRARRRSPPKT